MATVAGTAASDGWMQRSRAWALLFLLYLAAAAATLGANPFNGQTSTPFDVLVGQHAWHWVDPDVHVRQPERTDILNALVPGWTAAREELRAGRFPLWNDRPAGGSPLLPISSSIFTPGFLVFAAFPQPAQGFYFFVVFDLAIAGLGMHLFLRRHVGLTAALAGAITFEFCGFHAAWLYWPHVLTAIWAPWLLLAVDRCAQAPGMRRSLGIAAATALLVLGGFPFVAEVVLGMAALYALALSLPLAGGTARRGAFASWCAVGIAAGFVACAPLLYELSLYLHQFDLGYRDNRGSYLNWHYLSRLLPPWAYTYKRVEETMYVGLAMTLCALAMVAACCLRPKRLRAVELFALALLVVAAGLVFGWWPMKLVGWIPGMAYNAWSRAIGILDIAMIVLGALAIDRLCRRDDAKGSSATPLRIGVLVLVAVQVIEMPVFFHRYNGAVSAADYYPAVPATTYLRQHVGPFDYVIADRSFHISGALGAYGLREWFAHQFRTPALQQALLQMVPNHVSSHTSSRFSAGDIATTSPLMGSFNVRYLAISSQDAGAVGPGLQKKPGHRPLPPLIQHRWLQQLPVAADETIDGVSVRMATYRADHLPGRVTLSLLALDGSVLAQSTVSAAVVVDNALQDFPFARPVTLARGRYALTLEYAPAAAFSGRLTAWAAPDTNANAPLLVDGTPYAGELEYVLHTATGTTGVFQPVFTGAGIAILENTSSPDGPYFLRTLGDIPDRASSRDVRVTAYQPARFTLRYSGAVPGVVVVPMSVTPEWHATVNGRPTEFTRKDGVLPAVAVAGPATITFEYVPGVLRWLPAWLASLLAMLSAMWFADRRGGPLRIRRTG